MIHPLLIQFNIYDEFLAHYIFNFYPKSWIKKTFKIISHSADGFYYPLIPIIIFFYNFGEAIFITKIMLIAFLIEVPIYKILKQILKRKRPFISIKTITNLMNIPDEFSFPSGHTSGAFLTAEILSLFFPNYSFYFFIWAVFVGISRVYLGMHYISDVLAGIVLGLLSAFVSMNFI